MCWLITLKRLAQILRKKYKMTGHNLWSTLLRYWVYKSLGTTKEKAGINKANEKMLSSHQSKMKIKKSLKLNIQSSKNKNKVFVLSHSNQVKYGLVI